MNHPSRYRQSSLAQRGFGLVEILVALAIGLLLMSGLVQIFISSKLTYRYQEALSGVQENGRIALMILNRDLRMAGDLGCVGNKPFETDPTATNWLGLGYIRNTLNSNTSYALDFGQAVQGYEGGSSGWTPALPTALSSISIIPGTDVVTVRGTDGPGIRIIKQPACGVGQQKQQCNLSPGSADLKVEQNNIISDNQILLAVDVNCQHGAIFQVTNYTTGSTGNVVHDAGGNATPGNRTKDLGANFTGGYVLQPVTHTYFLKMNSSNEPALYRWDGSTTPPTVQELVPGVQDMQITYGIDTNSDRRVDSYKTADQVTDWSQVMAIRITLLLHSTITNIVDKTMTVFFNDATSSCPNRRLCEAMTSTVALRNRVL